MHDCVCHIYLYRKGILISACREVINTVQCFSFVASDNCVEPWRLGNRFFDIIPANEICNIPGRTPRFYNLTFIVRTALDGEKPPEMWSSIGKGVGLTLLSCILSVHFDVSILWIKGRGLQLMCIREPCVRMSF